MKRPNVAITLLLALFIFNFYVEIICRPFAADLHNLRLVYFITSASFVIQFTGIAGVLQFAYSHFRRYKLLKGWLLFMSILSGLHLSRSILSDLQMTGYYPDPPAFSPLTFQAIGGLTISCYALFVIQKSVKPKFASDDPACHTAAFSRYTP